MNTKPRFLNFVVALVILGSMLGSAGTAYAQEAERPAPAPSLRPPEVPATPTNLRQSGATPTSITLAWDDVLSETEYRIYRWNAGSATYELIGTTAANVTTYTDDGSPTCGWEGDYAVSAYNAEGESAPSGSVHAATQACPPSAPTLILPANGASYAIDYNITFQWNAVAGATQYLVEWWEGANPPTQPCGWSNLTTCYIGPLPPNTYSWHVKARNADLNESDWSATWTFIILPAPPGAFYKSSPANGITDQPTGPTLSWLASSGAVSYEYCIDKVNDNACTSPATWTTNGAATSVALIGLDNGTTYYWQVRAINTGGTTYANGSSTSFWSFTTIPVPPGAFGKSSPANSATNQSTSPTLTWSASSGATYYEYCIDTTNDNACTAPAVWTSNGASTNKVLSGLSTNTTYYWQVRALNGGGTQITYANGAATAYWSFTTAPNLPGAFGKSSPANGATNQSTSPALSWGISSGSTYYEYCIDTTNDSACAGWTSTGTATSVIPSLAPLAPNTTYYWQVRAHNNDGDTYADGSTIAYWSFTTRPDAPAAFGKLTPTNGAIDQDTSLTLTWSSSTDVASYEYCYDTTNDNACSSWASNGTATSKALTGLSPSTTYYWQVRAVNAGGTTYADGSTIAYWSFTTRPAAPAAFNKLTPSNGATNQSTSPTLAWGASTGATSYEYCIDTTNDNACAAWTSTGTTTSVIPSIAPLAPNTSYYWQVRAINTTGTTYANGSEFAYWSFTTLPDPPAAFNKLTPSNGAVNQLTSLTLTWGSSTGATYYEYCYDTTNDNACSGWTSTGTATSKALTGLSSNTTYYWQVRAVNGGGTQTTYANGSEIAYWSFTTQPPPPPTFGKTSPINGATDQSTSPTLTWESNAGITSYEYCYDTTNDNFCSTWANVGTSTSQTLAGLTGGMTYYWQVRGLAPSGTYYADGASTAYWSFTVTTNPPGAFAKSSPTNGAASQSTSPTLSWGTSSGAVSYEYCYDTTNDNACSGWASAGASTSATLSGLAASTTYYWQVRAINGNGTTYANGASTAYWSFTTTTSPPPGAFGKTSPTNGATGQSTSPTLSWGVSSSAYIYEYCYDTTNDNACSSWTSAGASTSIALSGLLSGTTYYWQVRAVNIYGTTYADGASTAFWSFTTAASNPPGVFWKASPTNGAIGQSTSPTLTWTSSTGATSYEYCYDTTNDNACSSWASVGASTNVALSGLAASTTYYWQVRAVNIYGTTYADGASTAFWSFTTSSNPPLAFGKTSPTNGATGQSTSPTLMWGTSTGATSYEYCYDTTNDNACSAWASTGTATSVALSGLANGTTYYWQVRAINASGTTYADGASTAFWSFTTSSNPPLAFGKTSPANGATGQSTSPTLMWGTSTGAASYEYCYDTTNDNACSAWASTGTATSVALSGLSNSTTYYWQVRAINASGTTYADGASTAYWSFTTQIAPPLPFGKASPANGATGQSTSPTLTWGVSAGAASYEYCIDTTNDNACSIWASTGTATTVTLSGLSNSVTYYWQVRAINAGGTTYANGASTAFWSFTTASAPLPGNFDKTSPANGATGQSTSPTLMWGTSTDAASYEYCIDTTNDNACSIWTSTGTATSVALSGLANGTTYYWQVRAINVNGTTYANGSSIAYWSFTTTSNPPSAFGKTSPANGATDQSTSPTLVWETSAGATYYEYCIDTTNDNACSIWTNTGTTTSVALSGLTGGTTYYWQVRAVNASGTTYANGASTAFWAFTTTSNPPPVAFGKTSPADGATGQSTSPTLTWGASAGAASYEYCIDTTNDNACSVWASTGTATSIALSGLTDGTTYYWQVRAVNANGTTYADGASTAFWSFTTTIVPPPEAFGKSSPTDGATNQPTSLTLAWQTSAGAAYYEYCIDDTNDNACTVWASTGTATNVSLSGLAEGITYYWQVHAVNASGTTYADGASDAFWSFTTINTSVPGAFGKLDPADGATDLTTSPTLAWESSANATLYEYCIDATDDNACIGWTANGTSTSVDLSGLTSGVTYYWQVRASNASGTTYADGASTAFWSFTVSDQVPGAFGKNNPVDGATNQSVYSTLRWSTSADAVSYEYCYDTIVPCTDWIDNGASVVKSLSGLSTSTTYYWQVRAVNAYGVTYADGSSNAYWSFTTSSNPYTPPAPLLIQPEDGEHVMTDRPFFSWEVVETATQYRIEISTDPAFGGRAAISTLTTVPFYTPTRDLLGNTLYYWRVKAMRGNRPSAYSEVRSFITSDPPSVPVLLLPAKNALVSLLPTFDWKNSILPAGTTFDHYQIQVSTTSTFAIVEIDADTDAFDITASNYLPIIELSPDTLYYWRVRAWNTDGDYSGWSILRFFRTRSH